MTAYKSNTKSTKLIFLAISLAVILPLIVSYIYLELYQSGSDLGKRNSGELFEQTITLNDLNLELEQFKNKQSKWILLQIFDEDCQNECETRAHLVGNLVTALGKHSNRVVPVVLVAKDSEVRFLDKLNSINKIIKEAKSNSNSASNSQSHNSETPVIYHYPFEKMVMNNEQIKDLNQKLNEAGLNQKMSKVRLYFVDPLNRFVLGFKDETAPKQIIRDMNILLKLSLIG